MDTRRLVVALFCSFSACSSGGTRSESPDAGQPPPDAAVFDEGTGPGDLKGAPDLWLPPAEGKATQGQSLNADGTAVALGPDGAIYFAGSFSRADLGDGVVTSRGSSDGFLIKYDRTWRRLWARTFGRDYADVPDRVEVDTLGNATVVGYSLRSTDTSSHDGFVARFAADGTQRLFRIFGGPQAAKVDTARAVGASSDGGYYVAGGSEDSLDLGGGPLPLRATRDVYLAHFGPDGAHRWSRRFGKTSYNQADALVVAPDGDVLIAGTGSPELDFGDGNPTRVNNNLGFLARFSPAGVLRWSRHFPASGSSATGLANGPGGSVWVGGNFGGTLDLGSGPHMDKGRGGVYWASFDAAGRNLATFSQAGEGGLHLFDLAVDRFGQAVVIGQIDLDFDFGAGPTKKEDGMMFLLKRAPDGRLRYARRFGGTRFDRLTDVTVAPDDSLLVSGRDLSQDVTLDGVTLRPYGFVLALSP